MSNFKSPQLQLCGKICSIFDPSPQDCQSSFYIKTTFIQGQDWKLLNGKKKFQTFQSLQSFQNYTYLSHPFNLHYTTTNIRGWPRIILEVWKIDQDSRHNIYGYGTIAIPMATGEYQLQVPCWRPIGTWYERFVGSNSELQYTGIIASSLNRYGLRTFSGCIVNLQISVIGRNFHLHGVKM